MRMPILVIGAGGHGKAVAEAVLLGDRYELVGFVDDGWPALTPVWDYPVLGGTAMLPELRVKARMAIAAIGNNAARALVHRRLREAGFELATVVHPSALVSPRSVLGPGCALMSGAIVGTEALLGEGAIVNCGAVVDHHCHVADFGHLGTGATMAGGSRLGRGAWMQAGAALGYGSLLGDGEVLRPGESRSAS